MSTVQTTVSPSGLRILNLRELGWKENQPRGMGARGMAGMELSHPSGMRQQGTSRASAKAPRCSQRLLNQHHQQRDKTLPGTTQYNTGNCQQRDGVPSYTCQEPGEEREAARRGMTMDGCLFNSGDSLFPAFFHSPFHHLGEKPGLSRVALNSLTCAPAVTRINPSISL